MGFSSGLPYSLLFSTLQAWLVSAHCSLELTGAFSLAGVPYTTKVLVAPFLDRYVIFPRLGARRGWILLFQALLVALLCLLSSMDPARNVGAFALVALLLGLAGSSLDIIGSAYRMEIMEPSQYGIGSAVGTIGFRTAAIIGGALGLILADRWSFQVVYRVMAAIQALTIISTLLGPRLELSQQLTRPSLIEPIREFIGRRAWGEILVFLAIYKLDVVMSLALMTAFLLSLGFSKTDIGTVSKGFGVLATIAGTSIGGVCVSRWPLKQTLLIFGVLQGLAGLCFYALTQLGHHYGLLVLTIAIENFCSGLGSAAYVVFFMRLCHPQHIATQYSLFAGAMSLSQVFVGSIAGFLSTALGWPGYFLLALGLGTPALVLIHYRFGSWLSPQSAK